MISGIDRSARRLACLKKHAAAPMLEKDAGALSKITSLVKFIRNRPVLSTATGTVAGTGVGFGIGDLLGYIKGRKDGKDSLRDQFNKILGRTEGLKKKSEDRSAVRLAALRKAAAIDNLGTKVTGSLLAP